MDIKYKDDFDGVNLMRSVFPIETDYAAMEKVLNNKKAIKMTASSMHYKNKTLCEHAGLAIDDLEAMLIANAYVFFSKDDADPAVLSNFLKQRSVKIINRYKNKIIGVDESEVLATYDTPEDIILAKETIESLIAQKNQLISDSIEYLESFLDKNKKILRKKSIPREFWEELLESLASSFVLKSTEQSFRRILVIKFSKTLKELT